MKGWVVFICAITNLGENTAQRVLQFSFSMLPTLQCKIFVQSIRNISTLHRSILLFFSNCVTLSLKWQHIKNKKTKRLSSGDPLVKRTIRETIPSSIVT